MAIEHVFVAGAGLMGHGMGQVHAAIGKQVALYEPELARAQAGRDRIAGNLDRSVAKGRLSEADRDAILERVVATRARIASRSAVVSLPFATARSRLPAIRSLPATARAASGS